MISDKRLELLHWKTYERKPENRRFMIEQCIYIGRTQKEIHDMALGEGQALHYFRRDELPALSIAFDFYKLIDEFFDQNKELG